MDRDDVIDDDGIISIDLGAGVSRRTVLKQLGAASAIMGTTAMAGCQSDSGATPTDTNPSGNNNNNNGGGTPCPDGTPNGGGNNGGSVATASRHPAIAPPDWKPSDSKSGSGNTDRKAVFVYQNSTNPFFVPMTCGFHDALNNYGWSGGAVAQPTNFGGQPAVQVALIEQQLQNMSAGDVLVTTILNSETFNDVIQKALDQDIVVINGHTTPSPDTWNHQYMKNEASGSNFSGGFSYKGKPTIIPHVGIRDARAGASLAAEAYSRLQKAKPNKSEYSVLLANALPTNPAVTRRVDKSAVNRGTAQRYLEAQSNPSVSIYTGSILQVDPRVTGARSQIKSTIESSSGTPDAVLGSGYWAAVAGGDLKRQGFLSEKTITGGFDLEQRMIKSIKRDVGADFSVAQDPYSQGYMNVPLAWIYLARGMEMKDLEWGVSVWDESNIGFADERRNWQQLDQWQKSNYPFY